MESINDDIWAAHLERISDYLLPGEGVWWKKEKSTIELFDSDDESIEHPEGPSMMYFQTANLDKVICFFTQI